MKSLALSIYKKARHFAEGRGILIADTKMEFGSKDGELLLIDELLTPDSSRLGLYINDNRRQALC
jgi:phosphoribosylaminoimidazole-succinocarboxamide synthase